MKSKDINMFRMKLLKTYSVIVSKACRRIILVSVKYEVTSTKLLIFTYAPDLKTSNRNRSLYRSSADASIVIHSNPSISYIPAGHGEHANAREWSLK